MIVALFLLIYAIASYKRCQWVDYLIVTILLIACIVSCVISFNLISFTYPPGGYDTFEYVFPGIVNKTRYRALDQALTNINLLAKKLYLIRLF